ncbi:MAG: DUF669 domain-containing protein [Ruminococcus sp.]|nr:DUF669 domain-containing protein [Ruminococcus sp.]
MAYDNNNFQEYGWEDEINEEGSGDWEPLPECDYLFKVIKVERARFAGSEKMPPCNQAKVTISILGENREVELTENLFLCNRMEWKLSAFFLSIGMKRHGEPLRMNWTGAVGKTGRCHVYIDTYTKKDGGEGKSNKIKKFYAYDDNVQVVATEDKPAPTSGGWKAGTF